MKRRSFFTSLFKAAAIVALAPQIAFRTKPIEIALPKLDLDSSFWNQTSRFSACYSQDYDFMTDRATADKIQSALVKFYENKKAV